MPHGSYGPGVPSHTELFKVVLMMISLLIISRTTQELEHPCLHCWHI